MRDTRKHQEGTKLRKGGLVATKIVTNHCEGAGHEVLHREAVGGGKKKTTFSGCCWRSCRSITNEQNRLK